MTPSLSGLSLEDFVNEIEELELNDIPAEVRQEINSTISRVTAEPQPPTRCTAGSVIENAEKRKEVYSNFADLYSPEEQKKNVAEETLPNLRDLVSAPKAIGAITQAQEFSRQVDASTASMILQQGAYTQERDGQSEDYKNAIKVNQNLVDKSESVAQSASDLSSDEPIELPTIKALDEELELLTEVGPIYQWQSIDPGQYENNQGLIIDDGIKYIQKFSEANLKSIGKFAEQIEEIRDKCPTAK